MKKSMKKACMVALLTTSTLAAAGLNAVVLPNSYETLVENKEIKKITYSCVFDNKKYAYPTCKFEERCETGSTCFKVNDLDYVSFFVSYNFQAVELLASDYIMNLARSYEKDEKNLQLGYLSALFNPVKRTFYDDETKNLLFQKMVFTNMQPSSFVTKTDNDISIFLSKKDVFLRSTIYPSLKLNGITYDVVLEMEKSPNDTSFLHAPLKIFSNDPSYTYNYTWVMNQNGTIPEKLIPKCSTIALTDPPEIRNPLLLFHLHKYSIILRFHILFKGYLNPRYLEKDREKFISFDSYVQKIPSQEQKIEEIKKKYPASRYKKFESDIAELKQEKYQQIVKSQANTKQETWLLLDEFLRLSGLEKEKVQELINNKTIKSKQENNRIYIEASTGTSALIKKVENRLVSLDMSGNALDPVFVEKTIATILGLHDKVISSKDETIAAFKSENSFLKEALVSMQEIYDDDKKTIEILRQQLQKTQEEVEFVKRKYKLMWGRVSNSTT